MPDKTPDNGPHEGEDTAPNDGDGDVGRHDSPGGPDDPGGPGGTDPSLDPALLDGGTPRGDEEDAAARLSSSVDVELAKSVTMPNLHMGSGNEQADHIDPAGPAGAPADPAAPIDRQPASDAAGPVDSVRQSFDRLAAEVERLSDAGGPGEAIADARAGGGRSVEGCVRQDFEVGRRESHRSPTTVATTSRATRSL